MKLVTKRREEKNAIIKPKTKTMSERERERESRKL
jgi:hypothetical protein